ncbi:MAG: HNH endonuclease [Crinalium sp.]
MKKCIICKFDKSSESFSEEHIFPDSIGGTIILDSVCKECNDFLGHSVDSYLVNHLGIQLSRSVLKISGKKGKVPNPLEKGTFVDDDGTIQQGKNLCDELGNPIGLYIVSNSKGNIIKDNYARITIDKKDKNKLPAMVNKKLTRNGLRELSSEEIAKYSIAVSQPDISLTLNREWDLIKYQIAILKIAYELAFYWLGESYLNDSTGEKLRLCITDKSLEGEWYLKHPDIKAVIGLVGQYSNYDKWKNWDNEGYYHVGLMINDKNLLLCNIKIFDNFE